MQNDDLDTSPTEHGFSVSVKSALDSEYAATEHGFVVGPQSTFGGDCAATEHGFPICRRSASNAEYDTEMAMPASVGSISSCDATVFGHDSHGKQPASECDGTVFVNSLSRDIRPPTSLFGELSFSKTGSSNFSSLGERPASSPMRLEHFSVLTREDGTLWELGRGAMGVTYKALDTRLHCHVALKVINADLLARSVEARERFLREARAAARLRHSNIASVFHLGETPDGHAFYAMEFIEGETLDARVRRRGPVSANLVLEIGIGVTRGLIAASHQNLIHRDLKPANLMLVAGGGSGSATENHHGANDALVKVIDFGLAKVTASNGPATRADAFLGTPQFASPEQFSDNDALADARSDIYSLGATLWFALTGKLPFPGRSAKEVRDGQLGQNPPLDQLKAAQVPEPVAKVLLTMLAADPAERPQTPYALLEAFRGCQEQIRTALPVPAATKADVHQKLVRVPRALPSGETHSGSGAVWKAMAGALLLAATVGGVGYLVQHQTSMPAIQVPAITVQSGTPVGHAEKAPATLEKSGGAPVVGAEKK